jgi:hypothetical protein
MHNVDSGHPMHVLLRFSDGLHGVPDPIGAHNAVAREAHEVWFGKFGRGMAPSRIRDLNQQISRGVETHLYLVQRGRAGYELHRAAVAEFALRIPAGERRIPPYYSSKNLFGQVSVWARIGTIEFMPPSMLDSLVVASSRRSARDSLRGSVAGMFFVAE